MKKISVFLFLFALALPAFGQFSPPAASQAEVNAGTVANKYVSPKTLAAASGTNSAALVTTNTVGGTNQVVSILNGGGTGTYGALSNYVPKAAGQLVVSTAGTSVPILANYPTTTQGDFKHGFQMTGGSSQIGDPALMDPLISSLAVYLNGAPASWGTNSTGDSTVDAANMSTYGSGSGFNCDIITNDSAGVPHLYSRNSAQFMYVPTNTSVSGPNKTNLFGGYHAIIGNYSSINRGFLIGGPKHVGAESGNPNHYFFGVEAVDSTGAAVGKVKIPILTAGVSVPDDPNDVGLAMFDTIGGVSTLTNATLIGASSTFGPFVVNSGSAITVTTLTVTAAFNASSTTAAMNLNSTNVTIGQNGTGNIAVGSFGRLKINSGGDTANGDIFNSQGSGMSMSGATVFLSAGTFGIFAGTASVSSFTNDVRALSITVTNGTIYSGLSTAPTFAQIGSVTNTTFMWNSNAATSKAPTNWLQYYAAPSTLTTISHFP